MSRFDELCQAYVSAKKGFFAQRAAAVAFAGELLAGMETHLGCPPFQLYFLPHNRDASSTKTRTADGAVWLDDDGLWRFAMALCLRETQDTSRKDAIPQTVKFEMVVRPSETGYTVKLKGWDDEFSLPSTDGSGERAAFYENVFQRVLDSYQQPGQRFLENVIESQRTIGS
jgi:hypothetical protein